jgi:hypothetical protein
MAQRSWTIQTLEASLPEALSWCRSDFERANVRALHGIEIRRLAGEARKTRRLLPREAEIAAAYGFRAEQEDAA